MIPYIINSALILAGCLVFYKLLLRKETFYRTNRYFLAACLLISFSLPLLPIAPEWSLRKKDTETVEQNRPPIPFKLQEHVRKDTTVQAGTAPVTTAIPPAAISKTINWQQWMVWLGWLYWFGVIVFGANFLLQVLVLFRKALRNPAIIDGPYRIVEVSGEKAPCSFGNNIFINPEKYDWETYNQILLHEKVHVRQNHSLDIMLAELMLVFQWFNPFAWVYRKQVEDNLEFLTDNELTQKEKVERSSYQLSLLKVSAPHFPLSLTTNYNQSILKTRIAMMNTKRSNMHTAWKYFFLLPVLAVLASLLNEPMAQTNKEQQVKTKPQISTEG
jgi:BlaR1 peptidase M56